MPNIGYYIKKEVDFCTVYGQRTLGVISRCDLCNILEDYKAMGKFYKKNVVDEYYHQIFYADNYGPAIKTELFVFHMLQYLEK